MSEQNQFEYDLLTNLTRAVSYLEYDQKWQDLVIASSGEILNLADKQWEQELLAYIATLKAQDQSIPISEVSDPGYIIVALDIRLYLR